MAYTVRSYDDMIQHGWESIDVSAAGRIEWALNKMKYNGNRLVQVVPHSTVYNDDGSIQGSQQALFIFEDPEQSIILD